MSTATTYFAVLWLLVLLSYCVQVLQHPFLWVMDAPAALLPYHVNRGISLPLACWRTPRTLPSPVTARLASSVLSWRRSPCRLLIHPHLSSNRISLCLPRGAALSGRWKPSPIKSMSPRLGLQALLLLCPKLMGWIFLHLMERGTTCSPAVVGPRLDRNPQVQTLEQLLVKLEAAVVGEALQASLPLALSKRPWDCGLVSLLE